jgi:hypothetical protein
MKGKDNLSDFEACCLSNMELSVICGGGHGTPGGAGIDPDDDILIPDVD